MKITEAKGRLAFKTHQELISLKYQMGMACFNMGLLLKRIRDGKLYEVLDYPTFTDYCHSPEVGIHYRTAAYYIAIWETFIEGLGYKVEELSGYSYDLLRKLLPIVRKGDNIEEVMEKALSLRWVDFEREYKAKERNEGFEDFLAPPEFLRCDGCRKWIVICPEEDICKCLTGEKK